MTDTWAPRTAAEYAQAIESELPSGPAWPRDPDGGLMLWVDGCAEIWGEFDARAADLLITESDPRSTLEMLPDWEAAFGLPDACVAEPLSITDRRNALVARMTALGAQSRAFFIGVAAALGYTITISEYSPFMCGVSQCGDTRPVAPANPTDSDYRWQVGDPTIRFWWRIHILGSKTRWFRAGTGQCGVDPMVRIGLATDLDCIIKRWKPAHTDVVFDYSTASTSYVTYNWFRAGQSQIGVDHMLSITQTGGIVDT